MKEIVRGSHDPLRTAVLLAIAGNYETLSSRNYNTFFLLKAKCAVIARRLDVMRGDLIVKK
jgi:uncharacterized protein with ATP-grasp and redox domains